jgi:hypothetical protein
MNQKWGNCERSLQRLKGIFNFNSLGKRLILPSQMSKNGHYCGIICNESPIKDGEPKKTLNILNRIWGSLIPNSLNLTRVHVNAISRNNITQKFYLRLIEFTLLQFAINTNFLKLFQNKMYMALMVYHVL